jgi:arylsulfatase A
MMRYFKEVGARLPKKNPNHDPAVYKKAKEYEQRRVWGPFAGTRPLEDDER